MLSSIEFLRKKFIYYNLLGFQNNKCDSSLFIQKTARTITVLLIYVDDILLTGNNDAHIKSLADHMHEVFSMKELGPMSYFLGISIQSTTAGYTISQQKYAHDILVRAGLSKCKPCSSLMFVKSSLTSSSAELFDNPSLYRSIVGALQYLTITRLDIAFTVNQLCQYMHTPILAGPDKDIQQQQQQHQHQLMLLQFMPSTPPYPILTHIVIRLLMDWYIEIDWMDMNYVLIANVL
ncbi:uncharacterized protein LOC114316452 [Camellia sinensis]|uniref:uncharacterized protein LOC114316452 n=1 Tax=Camellia sinensis TaxID=4442 RepID=UPI001035C6BD|nr:uncharacterized protein LOC114316452 [Camellia sinensis]